ncbi:retinoic acid receptor responder protein 2 [Candoia aspera]|uniref:retinoic acid receptor responder protein 2 n=1 Tax=Candoia aspera TaxID=51853 RepID=UPI002FD7C98D
MSHPEALAGHDVALRCSGVRSPAVDSSRGSVQARRGVLLPRRATAPCNSPARGRRGQGALCPALASPSGGHPAVNKRSEGRGQPAPEASLGEPVNDPPRSTGAEGGQRQMRCGGEARMTRWLALCAGLLVLAGASRPPLLQNALEKVLEDFHGRSLVQSAFRGEAAREVMEDLPMGTFVRLEVDLTQTVCKKQQWRTQSCQIKAGGRRQKCLACFKFDASNPGSLLDKSLRCLSEQSPVFQEVKRRQEQECEAVKAANEDQYLPGKFAFSVGLPS